MSLGNTIFQPSRGTVTPEAEQRRRHRQRRGCQISSMASCSGGGKRPPWSSAAGSAAPVPTSTAFRARTKSGAPGSPGLSPARRIRSDHRRCIGRHEEGSSAQAGHGRRPRRLSPRPLQSHRHGLIMGAARLVAPQTVEVSLNDGGTRRLVAEKLFLNLGTRASLPPIPGLRRGAATHQYRGARTLSMSDSFGRNAP